MNNTLKTVLLTILTLSAFTIAMIELSGVSQTALYNKLGANSKSGTQEPDKFAQEKKKEEEVMAKPKTTFEMLDTMHDFGIINEGDKVRHAYKIKNTGTNPLFIANVITSCGCTAPEFPKKPLSPGEESVVTLEFNSAGKKGKVQKNAMLISNGEISKYSFGLSADVKED